MNRKHQEHAKLPVNQFDARLAEELEERVEFVRWFAQVSASSNGQVTGTVGVSSQ